MNQNRSYHHFSRHDDEEVFESSSSGKQSLLKTHKRNNLSNQQMKPCEKQDPIDAFNVLLL
jgi:hypothetical protein